MLKLVLGGSGSGKTTHLYAQLRARAEAGQPSILLVPEQFTSSTEARLYRELGDELSGWVESFSFTSLAERILEQEGGAAVETLTDAGRAVLVRRALEELQDNVHYYYRHRRSAAFCQMAAQTIDELKSAGLTGGQLYDLAQNCGAEKTKLTELALIFQGYETLLTQTGMDPSDRLELAAQRLEDAAGRGQLPEFLEGRAVFIDEFDTFNAPKKRLMGAMLAALPEVTVALCDDGAPLAEGDLSLFSGAKRVAAQLKTLARKNGAEVAAPLCLREDLRHREAPGLAAVGQLIAWDSCNPVPTPAKEIRLYPAPSREEEARAAAGAIRRLMRQGVRCGKIAVVCRDLEKYRAALRYEFRMAEIPLYCDEATTPEFSAPATAVRALLDLVRGMDYTENLTALAKTGLCKLEEAEVCALENYAYTWSPSAAAWRQPFEKNPRGFGAADNLTEEELETRDAAERARAFLIEPVEQLRAKAKNGTAEQLSRALYFCLTALGAEEQQAAQVEEIRRLRGIPAAEEAAREWNVVMDLLNQMAGLLGSQTVTVAEYADLFGLLLRSSDLGHIPQSLDAVILASAGKMRLDEPDYVFVLGLAEGEFPAAPGESGLLGHADRDALIRQQIELPDCFENRVVREQVCFYKALTAPAKGLWLSWPKGAGLTLCAAAQPIVETLAPPAPALGLGGGHHNVTLGCPLLRPLAQQGVGGGHLVVDLHGQAGPRLDRNIDGPRIIGYHQLHPQLRSHQQGKGQHELTGKAVEGREAGDGDRADAEGRAHQGHALLQAAQQFHAHGAGGVQHFTGGEEKQALESRVVEHVEHGTGQTQGADPAVAAVAADEPGAHAHEHEAHVLHAGVGQQALEVALGQSLEDAHQRAHDDEDEHGDVRARQGGGRL